MRNAGTPLIPFDSPPGCRKGAATCQHFCDFDSRLFISTTKRGPEWGLFLWWRWWESNPRPRHADWRFIHRLGPFLKPSGGERTSRSERLPPGFRLPSGGVAAAYLVPPSGRPKPPFRRFNELGTQRSRGLARSLGCPRQREPVRSYRWQFDVGGLIRGPSVQPPPAPCNWITTCRNRSPPMLW